MRRHLTIASIRKCWLNYRTPWPQVAQMLRKPSQKRRTSPGRPKPSSCITPPTRRSQAMSTSTRRSTRTDTHWLLMVIRRATATVTAIATLLTSTTSTESTAHTTKMPRRRMSRIRRQRRNRSKRSKLTSLSSQRRIRMSKSQKINRSQSPQPRSTKRIKRKRMPPRPRAPFKK
jgi:hypothetical protein